MNLSEVPSILFQDFLPNARGPVLYASLQERTGIWDNVGDTQKKWCKLHCIGNRGSSSKVGQRVHFLVVFKVTE